MEPEGLPYYRPPRYRSLAWAWLLRRPTPEWMPTQKDPNPNERWWRRG